MRPDEIEFINALVFFIFTALLLVGLLTTWIRRAGLLLKGIAAPRLLPRDMTLMLGLAWPFALILLIRTLGLQLQVAGQLWWTIVTGIPPIVAMTVYVYYEIFIIGQPDNWRSVVRHHLFSKKPEPESQEEPAHD